MTRNIWKLVHEVEKYAAILLDSEAMYRDLPNFEGLSLHHQWPQNMSAYYAPLDDENSTILPIPHLGYLYPGMFTCGNIVRNSGIFDHVHVEFLPIKLPTEQAETLWAVNVLTVIPCLDEQKSHLERFQSSGNVKAIHKYVFTEGILQQQHEVVMFKIPQMRRTELYVTDRFKEHVAQHRITGVRFEKIYSFDEARFM